ncbi:hypothetical protein J4429_06005 [Candidatus Pacearchaeota archaeon]|nr:hypothetical protein [Candidatus Pacearchaeota archaeon]
MKINKNKFTEKELKIINKFQDVFEALENYDKIRELLTYRKRLDITPNKEN